MLAVVYVIYRKALRKGTLGKKKGVFDFSRPLPAPLPRPPTRPAHPPPRRPQPGHEGVVISSRKTGHTHTLTFFLFVGPSFDSFFGQSPIQDGFYKCPIYLASHCVLNLLVAKGVGRATSNAISCVCILSPPRPHFCVKVDYIKKS